MQVPRRVYPEIPPQGPVRRASKAFAGVFHDLAKQRESKIEQGNLVIDHVPMLISIPPKYSVGPSHRVYQRKKRDPHSQDVCRTEEKLDRPSLLGTKLLRVDGGGRRGVEGGAILPVSCVPVRDRTSWIDRLPTRIWWAELIGVSRK